MWVMESKRKEGRVYQTKVWTPTKVESARFILEKPGWVWTPTKIFIWNFISYCILLNKLL